MNIKKRVRKYVKNYRGAKTIIDDFKKEEYAREFFRQYKDIDYSHRLRTKYNRVNSRMPGCVRCSIKFYSTIKSEEPIKYQNKYYCSKCFKEIKND